MPFHMLRSSQTDPIVITGVSLRTPKNRNVFRYHDRNLRHLYPAEIEAYVATGCPMDKAGAYAIQGGAAPSCDLLTAPIPMSLGFLFVK